MGHASRAWSCDTFAVRADRTRLGATLFGKNSDRPARECQPLRVIPARSGGGRLSLAYVEIDDVDHTYAHLGSSPYWCWGHEIGVNERGVAIGNEALFTRPWADAVAAHRRGEDVPTGLLGMETLRLALERASTASEAVEVITSLTSEYGQWGAGVVSGDRAEAAYDNAFLVADKDEIWIVETAGRDWATRRVGEMSCSISNEPSIRSDATAVSAGCAERFGVGAPFDWADAVVDPGTPLQVSHVRLMRSRQLLGEATAVGSVDFAAARRVLADHYEDSFLQGPAFNPARPDFLSLCMHEHPSGFTWGNTAASMVAMLPAAGSAYVWWAPTTPCTSVYLPVRIGAEVLPEVVSAAGSAVWLGPNPETAGADTPDVERSYWWAFDLLLQWVGEAGGRHYYERHARVRAAFDPLQSAWLEAVDELVGRGGDPAEWDELSARCAADAHAAALALLAAG